MKLLVVEDEDLIASFLEKGLEARGYAVVRASTGSEALEAIADKDLDLVILDLRLPDVHGLDVLRRVRERGHEVPVIVVSALGGVEDRIAALDIGADDYLPKPFDFDELLARVRARLRPGPESNRAARLVVGPVELDLHDRSARAGDRAAELTAREFSMFEEFLRHPGQVLSRQQILSRVWGLDFDPSSNLVDVYVRRLRGKLGMDLIETIRGVGYRLPSGGAGPGS